MADTTMETIIGPEHRGQRMTLDAFAQAEGQAGHTYELSRGVIIVVDVPDLNHGRIVYRIRQAIADYGSGNPGVIDYVAGGAEAALRLPAMQSERHPDIAIYLKPPFGHSQQPWDAWTPDIVLEVVSESSVERDYVVKREEYLRAGVRIYGVVDPFSRTVTLLNRRGDAWDEQIVELGGASLAPLLPGCVLTLESIFADLS